jgi:hypothetical protein
MVGPSLAADLNMMGASIIGAVNQEAANAHLAHFAECDFLIASHHGPCIWSLRGFDFSSRALDLLSIFIINAHNLVIRRASGFQKFVKFGVNGLPVPVFRSLNNKRHVPGSESGNGVPSQPVA